MVKNKKQIHTDTQLSLFADSDFGITSEDLEVENEEEKGKQKGNKEEVQVGPTADYSEVHYDLTNLFEHLSASDFRSSFHLKPKDRQYIDEKGLDTIRKHAEDFVTKRLAPAFIPNDGKQTPMRGHPVFLAQHATGCCCRGCFSKWHHIPQGRALTPVEQHYAVEVLMTWIRKEYSKH